MTQQWLCFFLGGGGCQSILWLGLIEQHWQQQILASTFFSVRFALMDNQKIISAWAYLSMVTSLWWHTEALGPALCNIAEHSTAKVEFFASTSSKLHIVALNSQLSLILCVFLCVTSWLVWVKGRNINNQMAEVKSFIIMIGCIAYKTRH